MTDRPNAKSPPPTVLLRRYWWLLAIAVGWVSYRVVILILAATSFLTGVVSDRDLDLAYYNDTNHAVTVRECGSTCADVVRSYSLWPQSRRAFRLKPKHSVPSWLLLERSGSTGPECIKVRPDVTLPVSVAYVSEAIPCPLDLLNPVEMITPTPG